MPYKRKADKVNYQRDYMRKVRAVNKATAEVEANPSLMESLRKARRFDSRGRLLDPIVSPEVDADGNIMPW